MIINSQEGISRMYRKIVVCIDDKPLSEEVTKVGADLAIRYDAEIVLLSVVDPARYGNQPYTGLEAVQMLERHSRSLTNSAHRLSALLHSMGIRNKQVILPGRSVETILSVSESESADLIVIGTEARGLFSAWINKDLWGEVSHKASCNVLRVTPADWSKDQKNGSAVSRTSRLQKILTAPMSAL